MQTLVSIQHWLYGGMANGLGAVVAGKPSVILLAKRPQSCSARCTR